MLQGFLATKLASSLLSQFRSFGKSDIENDYLFLLCTGFMVQSLSFCLKSTNKKIETEKFQTALGQGITPSTCKRSCYAMT